MTAPKIARLLRAASGNKVFLYPAIYANRQGIFRADNFPGIAECQPVVGAFALPAIVKFLSENTVLISDAIAIAWQLFGGQRVEIAGRQAAKTAAALIEWSPKRAKVLRLSVNIDDAVLLGELVPEADVVMLGNVGHYPHVEDPAAVLEAFFAFHESLRA